MTQHGLGQVSSFYLSKFILSISSIMTMHKYFLWPEGCEGIFKNLNFKLNKTNFHLAIFSI